MLVFIDESGDAGFKFAAGSSKYFIVALVAFENPEEALAADHRINLLRREMQLSDRSEFHFNKSRPTLRRRFLSAIAPYDFFYWGIVIDKALLTDREFRSRHFFYKYACGLVFENARSRLNNATVVVDGSDNKDFCSQLKTYLRRRLKVDSERGRIKKLTTQDSRKHNLLQLADMVVGAIARSYSGNADAQECRKLIEHHEMSVQFWPK